MKYTHLVLSSLSSKRVSLFPGFISILLKVLQLICREKQIVQFNQRVGEICFQFGDNEMFMVKSNFDDSLLEIVHVFQDMQQYTFV